MLRGRREGQAEQQARVRLELVGARTEVASGGLDRLSALDPAATIAATRGS